MIRLQNIGDGVFRDDRAHVSVEHFERLGKHAVEPGDVLVATLGEVLPRACLAPPNLGPAIVKADCIRVRPAASVSADYVMWALNAPPTRDRVAQTMKGVGRPRINLGELRVLGIPVAPLAEQERMVTAIEEAFSKLDAGESGLRAVRQRLSRMRDSVLAAAASGYLLPRDPTDTTGSELPGRDGLDHPADLPSGWSTSTVGDLAEFVTDGDHRPPKRVPAGVPHLTAKNVRDGRLDLRGCTFVDDAGFAQTRKRYEPLQGDVIVTCVGTIGRIAVVPAGLIFSADRNLAAIRPKPGTDSAYLRCVLESPAVRRGLVAASGAAAQPHLYLRDLRSIVVTLAPHDEQLRVVAEVERQFSFIEACERAIEVGLARSRALRRSVLKAAFEGKLVPQDPADEPASMLLERIRAEREAAGATPKRSRRTRTATQ